MEPPAPSVVILTPVKQAAGHLETYVKGLAQLAYPADRLSLGFLESDSTDGTYERLAERLPELRTAYRPVTLVRHDFDSRCRRPRRGGHRTTALPRRFHLKADTPGPA